MSSNRNSFRNGGRKELVLLLLLVLAGLLLIPVAIYLVGGNIFGPYAGNGIADFYRDIYRDLGDGQAVVVFLLLSPYIVWQLLRLAVHFFRRMAPPEKSRSGNNRTAGNSSQTL